MKPRHAGAGIAYETEPVTVTPIQLAHWRGIKTADSISLGGQCPKCGHNTLHTAPTRLTGLESAAPEPQGPLTSTISCACKFPHSGRPDGVIGGCGRNWTAELIDNGDTVRLTPAGSGIDPVLLLALQAVYDVGSAQLSDVRNSAEKWIAAVTTITGLFSLTGVVVSRDTAATLSTLWRVLAGLGALTALTLAVLAVCLIFRAAYGWPTTADVSDNARLRAWYLAQQDAPFARARAMKAGVRTAGASLAALATTAGLLWFAPQQPPAATLTQVTLTNGSRVCGTLLPNSAEGMIVRRASDGTTISVPLRSAAAVTAVPSC